MTKNERNVFLNVKQTRNLYTFRSKNKFAFHIWENATTAYHQHENYVEIFILVKGSISNTMMKETKVLQPGDIGIVFPGTPHIHETINDDETQLYNFTCETQTAEFLLKTLYNCENFNSKLYRLSSGELTFVKNFKKVLFASQNDLQYFSLIKGFIVFLLGIISEKAMQSNNNPSDMPESFRLFVEKINNMDLSYIKINDLYLESGYSQRQLSRLFQKYFNQSLVFYINGLKLNKARSMLLSTDMSITKIATVAGFNSLSLFNHIFKERYGITPKDYKNHTPQLND